MDDLEKEYHEAGIEMQVLKFPNGISPEVTRCSDFNWGYSTEFQSWIEGTDWMGQVFYD